MPEIVEWLTGIYSEHGKQINKKKSFIKGRKQEFEILMMYYWVHDLEGDEIYWDVYLEKTLPFLKLE